MVGKRIVVLGATGSGKTTLSKQLARRLSLAYIEMDALFWLPGWKEKPLKDFMGDLKAAMAAAPDGWVADGGYLTQIGSLTLDAADTIVWLALPFHITYRRMAVRTLRELFTRELMWGTNRASFQREFLSRRSILLFAFRQRTAHFTRYRPILESADFRDKVLTLRTPKEVTALVSSFL